VLPVAEARVEAALKQLRNRIWLAGVLGSLSIALLASAVLVLLLVSARHVLVIPYLPAKTGPLLAALWLAGGILGLARRPGRKQTALAGDRLGLEDRLATYLEYGNRESAVLAAFRSDLKDVLAGFRLARAYPLNFPWKRVLAAVILFTAAAGIFWLPSPRAREAALREQINRELRQEAESVALMKNSLGEEKTEAGRDGGKAALLEELRGRLEKEYDYREAALQVADTLESLQSGGRGLTAADMEGLAGIFAGTGDKTAAAADLLRSGDADGAARALENLTFDGYERRALRENTGDLLAGAGQHQARKQVLEAVKSALEDENFTAGKLAGALKSALSATREPLGLEETEKKLESMKERLLAKGDALENSGGADGTELAGENEAAPLGGNPAGREAAVAQGDYGGQPGREPGALGGGISGGKDTGEAGRDGQVETSEAPAFAPDADAGLLEVRGTWQEDSGQITERESDRVLGLAGDNIDTGTLYRQFQREGMAYLDRFEIPPDSRQLVLGYFRELRGENGIGNTDGRLW
jgi:hypothetical protein